MGKQRILLQQIEQAEQTIIQAREAVHRHQSYFVALKSKYKPLLLGGLSLFFMVGIFLERRKHRVSQSLLTILRYGFIKVLTSVRKHYLLR